MGYIPTLRCDFDKEKQGKEGMAQALEGVPLCC